MPDLVGRTRRARVPPGVSRTDSDDELGTDDLPWEWIYDDEDGEDDAANASKEPEDGNSRKRTRTQLNAPKIVGARMGSFECQLGDTVLLKAEGSNEAWVGIICGFTFDEEEDEKAATFMWFSTEKEIRNSDKKRKDAEWVSRLSAIPGWPTSKSRHNHLGSRC